MLTSQEAEERAEALVARARKAGADAADAVYSATSSEAVQVRLGKLEDVERSESESLDLRVFVGQRSASIGTAELSDASLEELAARAVAMASAAPEDPYAGLADPRLLAPSMLPDLDLFDPVEPGPHRLKERALAAEDAARSVDGVTNSEGASASAGAHIFAVATSHGFVRAYSGTMHGISATVVAGNGAGMQRDYAWRSAHHLSDLATPESIGLQAGQRAVARLNPARMNSGAMPVVFDPRVAGTLIGHLVGAMNGSAIARRTSFLLGKEGTRILPPGIAVIDDPLRPRGLSSRAFDGEGLPTRRRALIEDGVLGEWLMDSAAARQLGKVPTGQAARGGGGATASNVHLEPGLLSPAQLMADIADGVYVTELIGHGVNGVTGDYSRGASGFRIVNGELAGPVAEFTVAGNLLDMFAQLAPANDLEWFRAINVPTVRIDGMTIASA